MASDLGDGDYLGAYRRFFVDFLDKVNPDDQLPIKTNGHDVTEAEVVGETVHMTLQYLNQELCPPSLQCYIVQQVIEEIRATCRKEPEACGFRQEENTYAPLKLMQAVAGKVNEICQRYLENSRLALLPPPPSSPMPLATAFAIRNTRRKMEDRHVVLHDLNTIFNIKDDSVASYYAVFDGHAGYQAAVYCAAHLHQYLAESRHYPTDPERALRDAFLTTDELFIQKSTRQTLSSGTTAVCALILKKKLYVAWVGDSQAALAKRGTVSQLVNPHKPDRNDERERIEVMGGAVIHNGTWRVNGNLAVSRAIGDAQYKPYVTGNPEISCISLDGYEDFLIIACDGLWDYVTENEAAGLVYREVHRDPYDYDSVSQRLVEYAKNQGSSDNITVIVVFLTAPVKIASRPQYGNPLFADVQLNNMDPDNRFVSNSNGQFDVNSPFAKQPSAKDVSPDLMDDEDPFEAYDNKSSNGKHHENGAVPVRDYDAEEDDEDLGPETDVDAIDEVADSEPTLADVSRQLFPEKQDPCELYQADEGVDDDSPPSPDAKKTNQQALIPEADNVGDSEDSEDEWNYYRIEPNKEKDQAAAAADTVQVAKGDSEIVDSIVVSSPSDHGDVQEIEKEQESADNDTDSCSSESDSEREVRSSALIDAEISPDNEVRENQQSAVPINTEETNDPTDHLEENRAQEEDMDFQLNPNAAEFVPVSPTPIIPTRSELDAPIAGSPLKQTPLMDDMKVPSRREFQNEVRHRPGEIEEKCGNGALPDDLDEEYTIKRNETAAPCLNMLDESEVSSTKAEFGDESSLLTMSEFHKTGVSNFDGSFTDSNVGFDDSTMDPMTKSFGPGDFMALSNSVDLNAVHDLTDADLMVEENSVQDERDQERNNLLNIEESEEPTDIDGLPSWTVLSVPDNQTGNVLDSSSPVSSLHAHDLHQDACDFGSEIDKPGHDADGSISEMLGVERLEEKHTIESNLDVAEIEPADARSDTSPGLVDETNVTSKLLEMDLEDRGSQDCGFEKCNETWRTEEPKFEQTEDNVVESSAKSEEPTDFISSPMTEENLIECSDPSNVPTDFVSPPVTNDNLIECPAPSEAAADFTSSPVTDENLMDSCCMPESLPIASTNFEESSGQAENPERHAIDEMVKSFGDLHAHDDSTQNNVRDVPVLQNPLDLNVDSPSRTSLNNLALEDPQMVDYVVAKAPESPGVGVSPLEPQRSNNPFGVVDNAPLPTSQTESRSIGDFETPEEIPIKDNHVVNETPLETEEAANVSTGLKLSESLQEFTGLEQQLNPEKVTNGLAPEENLMEIHNEELKETDIVQKQPEAQIVDEVAQKIVEEQVSSKEPLTAEENTVEPASRVEEAAIAAAVATAAGAIAATAAAKPTKSKPTTKTAQKPAATKTSANKSTPTSPTKAAVPASRSLAAAGPKKPATSATAARPNKLETGAKAGPAAPASKTATATKSTLSAPKTSARLSSASASSPRGKLPSTTSTKPTTTLADKKPMSNGDATKSSVSTASKVGSATSKAPAKPLVKSAPSARPTSSVTATAKPKVASTTTSKVSSRASMTTGTVGTTTQRPKTAPAAATSNLASKSRLASATSNSTTGAGKLPITEKQIKETANKQISSSRTSTTTTASKTSRTSITSSTTTTSKRVGSAKTATSTTAPAVPPPIKKPAPISRLGAKTAAATAKSNATKATSTTTSKTKVVVQNGVCTAARETNVVTSTTITRNSDDTNEEDVPKKDASPVEMPTDNQLIIAAD